MNDKWKIIYYVSPLGKGPVKDFIDSLENKQQIKILRLFKLIQEFGLSAIGSHLKKLTGTPFWEIRILGQDNIRAIYVIVVKNTILILNCFVKKGNKTPPKEISIALSRYKDWLDR